jgi:hypothetical protein
MAGTHSLQKLYEKGGKLTLLSEIAVEVLLGAEAVGELLDHVALGAFRLFDHAENFNITGAGNSQH